MNEATQQTVPASGRADLSLLPEIFETCAGCAICRDYCPVFLDLFALLERRSHGEEAPDVLRKRGAALLDACFFCGRCEHGCPMHYELGAMAWKRTSEKQQLSPNLPALRRGANPLFLRRIVGLLGGFVNILLRLPPVRWLLERFARIDRRLRVPRLARPIQPLPRPVAEEKLTRRVLYFPGCSSHESLSEEVRAALEILARSGVEVRILDGVCCGAMEFGGALADEAARSLSEFEEVASSRLEDGWDLVVHDPSCVKLLRKDAALLKGAPSETHDKLVGRAFELTEYLWRLCEEEKLPLPQKSIEKRVAYHFPCASQVAGLGGAALKLLRLVPGLEIARLEEGCCGMGEGWGMRPENFDRSREFAAPRFHARVGAAEAQAFVSECGQCRLQAVQGAPALSSVHPLIIYRESLE